MTMIMMIMKMMDCSGVGCYLLGKRRKKNVVKLWLELALTTTMKSEMYADEMFDTLSLSMALKMCRIDSKFGSTLKAFNNELLFPHLEDRWLSDRPIDSLMLASIPSTYICFAWYWILLKF